MSKVYKKFVSPELAIELQKFNYNTDECFGYFVKQIDETYLLHLYQDEHDGYTNKDLRIDAPLISEVLDWLFEKHHIHIEFQFNDYTWFAYIGKLTVPDFSPDIVLRLDIEPESFDQVLEERRNIILLAIHNALSLINKN